MFEEEQICPYTGLRSFTEEESIYFKGREEEIDKATDQLQRNKFLMLTGASGDGKSSLIYAGIIPNAKAGFLKSKYSNWGVADFRPERTPYDNLCRAIARELDIPNTNTVRSELNHGFSAIIDLYKNSKRFVDVNAVAWQKADDKGKAAMKRDATNLIILVDQFEEFFTNPENYHRGVPSPDSSLVLNLLLETARIALEEDLPIYIVFTMRSDYIGQCASFRGLPEYIGFSQFFVPRLNRTQLQQVVEEPSVLSGNRITRRLTERLIHDLKEGVDQLPILQHALNQVWHAADNGKEEMDLIHYAMVGGMAREELPDDQVSRFEVWFKNLPPEIQACYHEPNLQNVLDTHTNKLYEQAASYYTEKTGKEINEEDAKAIIKNAFICLTKIDQSRAVRNRMTLKEITDILGRPDISTKEVGAVLNIFREPGNTFIRPFITEDPSTQQLKDEDVLDITHESLIRNWEYLEQWAKEEFDNYTISLDFEQQLNRWIVSGKSSGFLLPIGPLTYFENWFQTVKPNAFWIARYLPEEIEQDKKFSNAKQVLGNGQEFLKKSARRQVVTRAVMRYGPKRIAAVVGLLAIITLSSFAVRNYFRKKNDYVTRQVKNETLVLANHPKLTMEFAVPIITEEMKGGILTIPEVIDAIPDINQKIKVATGIATQLVTQGRYEPKEEILQSLTIADSLLSGILIPPGNREISEALMLINNLGITAEYACLYSQDKKLHDIRLRNATRSGQWAMEIIKTQPKDFKDIKMLSLALERGINYKIYSNPQVDSLLAVLSPLEDPSGTEWRNKNFSKDKVLERGGYTYAINYNGLYQDLAYLYVAAGNNHKALQCIDTLLHYQEGYSQKDYTNHIDNALNIAGVYYTYGITEGLDEFVQGYCSRKKTSPEDFYHRLVARAFMDVAVYRNVSFYSGDGNPKFNNLNLVFQPDSMLAFFFSKLKTEISKTTNPNAKNFNLAVALKNEGQLFSFRKEMRGEPVVWANQFYQQAITAYQQVSKDYLDQTETIMGNTQGNTLTKPRKFLFLYPDFRTVFHPLEPRSITFHFNSGSFIDYVMDQQLFNILYNDAASLNYFESWLQDYNGYMTSRDQFQRNQLPYEVMEQLATQLEARKANQVADLNLLYLHLASRAFDRNEKNKGIALLEKVQPAKLLNSFQYYSYYFINHHSFEVVGKAIADLYENNRMDLAQRFINAFKKEINRSSLYGYASYLVSAKKFSTTTAMQLADSARVEMERLKNQSSFQPNRTTLAFALLMVDPDKYKKEALALLKRDNNFYGFMNFAVSHGFHGNLYKARHMMPSLMSAADKSLFLYFMFSASNMNKTIPPRWSKFDENNFFWNRIYPVFVNEND